jgi:hypothetical protein
MAQHEKRQSEWPIVKRERVGVFAVPDGYFQSNREVAGPLRFGTEPGCGPRGDVRDVVAGRRTDMGMDRSELKPVDRIGVKYPETDRPVRYISEGVRRRGSGY